MSKTLLERFSRYHPSPEEADVLRRAEDVSLKYAKEKRVMEISASFDRVVDKSILYSIEDKIRTIYELAFANLIAHIYLQSVGAHLRRCVAVGQAEAQIDLIPGSVGVLAEAKHLA